MPLRCQLKCLSDGVSHTRGHDATDTTRNKRVADDRCVLANQHDRSGMHARHRNQRREILTLAHATGDQYNRPAQALEAGDRCTHIGTFAVIVKIDTSDRAHKRHPMRLTNKVANSPEQIRQPAPCRPGQHQRRLTIQGIVQTLDSQRINRHQSNHPSWLALGFWRVFFSTAHSGSFFIELSRLSTHQPLHIMAQLDPEVTRQQGHLFAKRANIDIGQCRHHANNQRIIAIDDASIGHLENARLGLRIVLHAEMPVEVILRQIHNDRGLEAQAVRGHQLKARELKHPDVRQVILIQRLHQCLNCCRTDVASGAHLAAGLRQHVPCHRCHGRLAIGSCHAKQGRGIAMLLLQPDQGTCEELNFTNDLDACRFGGDKQLFDRREQR